MHICRDNNVATVNSDNIHNSPLIVWADNADACAKQYAGTGALKTDFTR